MRPVKAAEQWLAALWPVVRRRLRAPPERIVEIGCGPLGGFVPMLRSSGYEALGVDPEAPDGDHYRRVTFELAELVQDADAVVASTSLHHVAEPAEVLDRVATTLASAGTLIVVEWALGGLRRGDGGLVLPTPRTGRGSGLAAQPPRRVGGVRPLLGRLYEGLGRRGTITHRQRAASAAR
jgi:SAM-dependent methyltransferase